jgi:hypothetical protein
MDITVMTMRREDDRGLVKIIQRGEEDFRIVVSSYNKHMYAKDYKKDVIKGLVIDFLVNGYEIQTNLLYTDIYDVLNGKKEI